MRQEEKNRKREREERPPNLISFRNSSLMSLKCCYETPLHLSLSNQFQRSTLDNKYYIKQYTNTHSPVALLLPIFKAKYCFTRQVDQVCIVYSVVLCCWCQATFEAPQAIIPFEERKCKMNTAAGLIINNLEIERTLCPKMMAIFCCC